MNLDVILSIAVSISGIVQVIIAWKVFSKGNLKDEKEEQKTITDLQSQFALLTSELKTSSKDITALQIMMEKLNNRFDNSTLKSKVDNQEGRLIRLETEIKSIHSTMTEVKETLGKIFDKLDNKPKIVTSHEVQS